MEPTCKERHRWGTSVGYYGEPGVLRDHGGSGCLYPFGTGGYPACYQCGVASAQCGGIGSPGAVVPLCQVTLLASSPSLHHAYHGSLVTPLVCFWTPPLSLPVPVCVMCDVTTCASENEATLLQQFPLCKKEDVIDLKMLAEYLLVEEDLLADYVFDNGFDVTPSLR